MDAAYIAFAIPFFFALIGVEVWISRRAGERRYRFADSISSLSCGIGQQIYLAFLKTAIVGGYVYVYEHFALAAISPKSVVAWVALLFGVDFAYWTFHWASHRVNVIWATHVVHHQSEEYNLATALRQSWLQGALASVFYYPLAVAGFPPAMFVGMVTINTLYQFWIHTRAIGRIGPLEWVLNTPSHHRVHHGIDPKYIDKNYAGIFIIWDRIFGTFQVEEEEPVYGIVKPLGSYNPVWANAHYWFEMAQMAKASPRVIDKLRVWFMPPEWRPAELGGPVTIPQVSRDTQRKYDPRPPPGVYGYVLVNFGLMGGVTTGYLYFQDRLPMPTLVVVALLVTITIVGWSAFFESKPWALPLECARLALIVAATVGLTWQTSAFVPAAAGAAAVAGVLGLWIALRREKLELRGAKSPAAT